MKWTVGMKYYYVMFDHDCSSNAFTDNPYLLKKYIDERRDIVSMSTINMTGEIEADSYGDIIRRLNFKLGETFSWDNEIQFIGDENGNNVITFTDYEADYIGFNVWETTACIIEDLMRYIFWIWKLVQMGIVILDNKEAELTIKRLFVIVGYYRELFAELIDASSIRELDPSTFNDLFQEENRMEVVTHRDFPLSVIEIINPWVCYNQFYLDIVNDNTLPFDEDVELRRDQDERD